MPRTWILLIAVLLATACGASPVDAPARDEERLATGDRERPVLREEDRATGEVRFPRCSPAAGSNFLTRDAQQCWFTSEQGRWRVVSHDLHYNTLVVRVVAEQVDAAEEIGARFAEAHRERFSEIAIYVQEEVEDRTPQVRRVTWTRSRGFEYLDFEGASGSPSGFGHT